MKRANVYATNGAGVIKAPHEADVRASQPKGDITKGGDLRDGKKANK